MGGIGESNVILALGVLLAAGFAEHGWGARSADLPRQHSTLIGWEQCQELPGQAVYSAVATESRVHHILQAAQDHDIVVMAIGTRGGMESQTLHERV